MTMVPKSRGEKEEPERVETPDRTHEPADDDEVEKMASVVHIYIYI